jgi:hypothetical protein
MIILKYRIALTPARMKSVKNRSHLKIRFLSCRRLSQNKCNEIMLSIPGIKST